MESELLNIDQLTLTDFTIPTDVLQELFLAGLIKLSVAVGCGCIIGLDRTRRHKPASLATIVLITFGAALFGHISTCVGVTAVRIPNNTRIDTSRIASEVVAGVGWLGAGAILTVRGSVHGITTAATIWACAAIGLAAGLGFVTMAALGTAFVLLALEVLNPLALRARRAGRRTIHVFLPLPNDPTRICLGMLAARYLHVPTEDIELLCDQCAWEAEQQRAQTRHLRKTAQQAKHAKQAAGQSSSSSTSAEQMGSPAGESYPLGDTMPARTATATAPQLMGRTQILPQCNTECQVRMRQSPDLTESRSTRDDTAAPQLAPCVCRLGDVAEPFRKTCQHHQPTHRWFLHLALKQPPRVAYRTLQNIVIALFQPAGQTSEGDDGE